FLRRAQLHENSGKRLGKTVVNFLTDTSTFNENGCFLRGVRQACQLNCQGRLLRKRDQQLAVLHLGRFAPEGEYEEADVAGTKHQRIDQHAGVALTAVERERTGPNLPVAALDVHVTGLGTSPKHLGKRRACERHAGSKRWSFELAIAYVSEDPPLLE